MWIWIGRHSLPVRSAALLSKSRSNNGCHQPLFQRQIIQLPIVPSSWQLYKCLRTTTPCKNVPGTNEDAIAATDSQRGTCLQNRETSIQHVREEDLTTTNRLRSFSKRKSQGSTEQNRERKCLCRLLCKIPAGTWKKSGYVCHCRVDWVS